MVFNRALKDGVRPNVITFSSLLSALSRSRDKHAPLRAADIFARMLEGHVVPDTTAWTILITIWSKSNLPEKEEKVQEIYEKMLHAGISVDFRTFVYIFMRIHRYMYAYTCLKYQRFMRK